MAMMNAAAPSVAPNQISANGIHASGGIGRNSRAMPDVAASIRGDSAVASPTATPPTLPIAKPTR